jgi:ABC-2 type transport system ATP-binding protein
VGYLPEGAPLYGEMTPWSFLRFVAETRGMSREAARHAVRRAAQDARLGDTIDRPIETLSKGYRRRGGLASALLHDPMLLILDEPTDGLDPNQRHAVRDLIKRLGEERGLIISTHSLEEVEAVCTRAIIIDQGRIVVDKSPDALKQEHGSLERAFAALTRGEERVGRSAPASPAWAPSIGASCLLMSPRRRLTCSWRCFCSRSGCSRSRSAASLNRAART